MPRAGERVKGARDTPEFEDNAKRSHFLRLKRNVRFSSNRAVIVPAPQGLLHAAEGREAKCNRRRGDFNVETQRPSYVLNRRREDRTRYTLT